MRRASDPTDALSRLPSSTRLFIVLTRAEAETLVQWHPATDGPAARALAKIRTAAGLEPSALSPKPVVVAPLLRAKAYQAPDRTPRFRMAKARRPATPLVSTVSSVPSDPPITRASLDVDYVPFRDEAGGVYT